MLVKRSTVARLYDLTVSGLAFLRRNRRVTTSQQPVLINIGSGLVSAPGWINIEVGFVALLAHCPRFVQRLFFRELPASSSAKGMTEEEFCAALSGSRYIQHSIEYGLPFADNSGDFIYSSHLHEHLFRSDGQQLLREAFRVLRPGGILRICVPDLAHAIELFRTGQTERALAYFFYDRGPSEYTRHRYMYDFTVLRSDLLSAGFADVEQMQFRKGRVPDLELLDNREAETLYVEAMKPAAGLPSV
jgi:predicted SAM-dependent methyltransferase